MSKTLGQSFAVMNGKMTPRTMNQKLRRKARDVSIERSKTEFTIVPNSQAKKTTTKSIPISLNHATKWTLSIFEKLAIFVTKKLIVLIST